MGQVLTADNIPDLVIASTTTITMATTYLGKSTRITIGGQQYKYSSLTTLNFGTTGFNGLDTGSIASNTLYYIYAVQSAGTPGLVASLAAPTVGPTGFTAWKEVARCRTLYTAATLAAVANRVGGSSQALISSKTFFTPILGGTSGNGSGLSLSQNGSFYTRSGELADVWIELVMSAVSVAPTGFLTLGIPNATPNLVTGSSTVHVGSGYFQDNSGGLNLGDCPIYGDNTPRVYISQNNNTATPSLAANDIVRISYTIPIIEWSGLYT
jgi:hypothetical protein